MISAVPLPGIVCAFDPFSVRDIPDPGRLRSIYLNTTLASNISS